MIFLDPPFADDPWRWLLPACAARLAPGRFVYAEAGASARAAGRLRRRTDGGRAGQVHYHLLTQAMNDPHAP